MESKTGDDMVDWVWINDTDRTLTTIENTLLIYDVRTKLKLALPGRLEVASKFFWMFSSSKSTSTSVETIRTITSLCTWSIARTRRCGSGWKY